jgi:hypothetical protein
LDYFVVGSQRGFSLESTLALATRFLIPPLSLVLPAFAADKRAFQIKDLCRLRCIQDLDLSSDGCKLLF